MNLSDYFSDPARGPKRVEENFFPPGSLKQFLSRCPENMCVVGVSAHALSCVGRRKDGSGEGVTAA